MSIVLSHLNTAQTIVVQYKGDLPFSIYLKNFFSKNKKYGSKDRKNIAALCFAYYRVCKAFNRYDVAEVIVRGVFLTATTSNPLLAEKQPGWNSVAHEPVALKLLMLIADAESFFPFQKELSAEIEQKAFGISFLLQPKLFIRLRPNGLQSSLKKLAAAQLSFKNINETCLAFENGTKVEAVLELNKDYVVQDYNSQQTIGLLQNVFSVNAPINVWDCCAASGGKSIMVVDQLKQVQLTVSDVRDSILANLDKRFKAAAIKNYHSFEADLTQPAAITSRFGSRPFDLVICDAPCSGSGTWGRTPEQLAFFNPLQIDQYAQLQKKITTNVISAIKKGGYLLYITCSVFKKENKDVVDFLIEKYPLKLVNMHVLKGYEIQADTMFAALMRVEK